MRERNEATTTALAAASEALAERQTSLRGYETQVRCLGPAGIAGRCKHFKFRIDTLWLSSACIADILNLTTSVEHCYIALCTQLARLKEQVGAMEAQLLEHRQKEAHDRKQACEVCYCGSKAKTCWASAHRNIMRNPLIQAAAEVRWVVCWYR